MNKFAAEKSILLFHSVLEEYSVPFKANQFGLLLFDFSTRTDTFYINGRVVIKC